MPEPIRLVLHTAEPGPMMAEIAARLPQVETTPCPVFHDLPRVMAETAPDALYTVRFDPGPYPREALFYKNGPRWVANGGVGIDHFGTWDPASVTVTNAAGVAADMMAEYILGGFLHFTLDIPGLLADKAARHWDLARTVRPLAGQTLLILGLGHTGRSLAARAKALGMHVVGTRARPQPMINVDEVAAATDLAALLPRADFIAVCTPLTPATRGLIRAAELALAKPGAILADVSRGGIVDQAALAEALTKGPLAAAVLDVFETEPLPGDSPLWALENAIISPHCSAVHAGWDEAAFGIFLDNLDRFVRGAPLRNVVDPDRGY
jgi:phosphoglycerate dehydrogenase-like enzyme